MRPLSPDTRDAFLDRVKDNHEISPETKALIESWLKLLDDTAQMAASYPRPRGEHMDRTMLLDHLELAKRHIAEGAVHIENQKALLAKLEKNNLDSVECRRLLDNFEEAQELNLAHLDRLFNELEKGEQ